MITESRIQIKNVDIDKDPYNILLVEDNDIDVIVLESHLKQSRDFQFNRVGRLSEAIECLKSLKFDIVLLDLNLPDSIGLEGLIKIRQIICETPIVVLTGVDNDILGIMAMQRGAQDYLIKGIDTHRLLRAMRYAIERVQNAPLIPSSDSKKNRRKTQQHLISKSAHITKIADLKPHEPLTERELQVLKLLGKGYNNQEIASSLVLSLTTVKTHISKILQKLSVADRTKAIIKALYYGLI